jgi:hypothetical protein
VIRISLTNLLLCFQILLAKAIQTEGEADAGAMQPGIRLASIICKSYKLKMKEVPYYESDPGCLPKKTNYFSRREDEN